MQEVQEDRSLIFENQNFTTLNQDTVRIVQNSVAVTNEAAAGGAKFEEDIDSVRQNAMAYFAAQNRAVTKEDYVLWLEIAKKGKTIHALNTKLTQWRKSKNSLSSSVVRKLTDGYYVYRHHLKFSVIKSLYSLLVLSINFLKKMFGENINRINTNSNNAFERPVVLLLIFSSSYKFKKNHCYQLDT